MVFAKGRKVFIKTGFTDMRKQINGLAAIAESSMPEPPLSGAYCQGRFQFAGFSRFDFAGSRHLLERITA